MRGRLLELSTLILLIAAVTGLSACASNGPPGGTRAGLVAPEIAALSTYEASIGTLIEVYGSDFPSRADGDVMLAFQGTFDADGGGSYPVDDEFAVDRLDAGTLRWGSFGPFRVPFSPTGNETGTFHGIVFARILTNDGQVIEGNEPLEVSLTVRPSILVHELQPLSASCGAPVARALGDAAYRLRVEAIGFTPVVYTYTLAAPAVPGFAPVSIRRPATGRFDVVGENGDFIVPAVPEELLAYGAILTIQATDSAGDSHATGFAVEVHRPLEFFYNGNVTVAEVLTPVPVSGCIPGGPAGTAVSYSESTSETRSRSYSMSWNESWLSSHTVASASSSTIGLTESNGVGFATTDGEAFKWSLGGEVSGTIGISKLVSLGVKASFGVENTTSRDVMSSQNRTSGLDQSTTTTDTESASESMGGSSGEVFEWSVSSTASTARGFGGNVFAGQYGTFYRQTLRLLRRGVLVAYNQCGSAEVVGDIDFIDWAWSPDLAIDTSCPPLPESNLPPAECIVSPCLGE